MANSNSQYAPIAPIRIYEELKEAGFLGDYHLLLAHEVVGNAERYAAVFDSVVADKNSTIIMDNSVVELGYPVPVSMMFDACQIVQADYVALPDVLEDRNATIDAILEAGVDTDWVWADFQAMAIPQGRNLEETMECAREIYKCGVGLWGVARWMGTKWGTRTHIIKALYSEYPHIPIHVLGFSENIPDDIYCASLPGVIGIDSARPISYGLEGHQLESIHSYKQVTPRIHRKTSSAWSFAKLNSAVIYNMEKVRSWISQST